jgi:uncharacterized protein (DUF2235 family)
MSKRIVVLSDGTGNSAAKVWKTNVWRMFEAIDLTASDQLAYYDDGVGTSSFKPAAMLGGAFGYGLKRNVIALYKFLCRNYKTASDNGRGGVDDQIYAFGFSRGAFTIRILIGLVLEQGLLKAGTEAELDKLATEAYRNYRANNFKTKTGVERPLRAIRNLFLGHKHSNALLPEARSVGTIRFLGLWDTVAAYGLPVDEMTRGVSRYLWPLELPNRRIEPTRIERACHAICLDDQRTTFHPVLWDESNVPPPNPRPVPFLTSQEKVTQVWFSGVHSNVGGGYPDDSLAYIPLFWILKEAENSLLRFKEQPWADPDAFLTALSKEDKDGRLYDSRSGLGGYYRYGPRSVQDLCNVTSGDDRDKVTIERPKIHETVFRRTALAAHSYAPIGLPKEYDVVSFNASSQSYEIQTSVLSETSASAVTRYNDQERIVWSTVWRGRGIYFLTVLASLYLFIYPLAKTIPATAELTTRLRFLSDAIRLLSIPLPSAANRWIDAYARDPALFVMAASAVALLMALSAGLRMRIVGQMTNLLATSLNKPNNLTATLAVQENFRARGFVENTAVFLMVVAVVVGLVINPFSLIEWLWDPVRILLSKISPSMGAVALVALVVLYLPTSSVYALRSSVRYKNAMQGLRLRYAPIFFAISFCLIGVLFINHYLLNIEDSFGAFCKSTIINDHEISASTAGIEAPCYETDLQKCPIDTSMIDGSKSACSGATMDAAKCKGRSIAFDTRNLCSATKIYAEKDARYLLRVTKFDGSGKTIDGSNISPKELNWRMAWTPSDAGGKTLSAIGNYDDGSCGSEPTWNAVPYLPSFLRTPCNYLAAVSRQAFAIIAYPLKRTFDRPFGAFLLRYGSTGNEENFIDPDLPEPRVKKDTGQPIDRNLSEVFSPTRDGELFVYLNKPALGIWPNAFYNLNHGIAKVTVIRIPRKI